MEDLIDENSKFKQAEASQEPAKSCASRSGTRDPETDGTEDKAMSLSLGNDELDLSETAPLEELAIVAKPTVKLLGDAKLGHGAEKDVLRDLWRPGCEASGAIVFAKSPMELTTR